ncbi:MAG: DUF4411 family protein [Nitrospira sp.]|nr:DUF4411 family protein [Nitrospira sp.]
MNQVHKLFVLDTNIFIEAHRRYYAQDLCPGFWECMTHYCQERRMLSIDRVRAELMEGPNNQDTPDKLAEWVKNAPNDLFTSSAEQSVVDAFAEMMDWVRRNDQFRPDAKAEFARVADGWVAAYASNRGYPGEIQPGCQETSTSAQRLPTVRRQLPGYF